MVGCRCKEDGVNATVLVFWRGQIVNYGHKIEEVGKVILILGYKGIDKRNGNNLHKILGKSR